MPFGLRETMQDALGADFSNVRVHTDSTPAMKLNALAFTQGNEIHVAPQQWAPQTRKGQELLGHELGHVLQQRAGRVIESTHFGATKLNDDSALEREADGLGARAARTPHPPAGGAGSVFVPEAPANGGVLQRQQPPEPGSPLDQVLQALGTVDPTGGVGDFPGAFRILDGLDEDALLTTLTELEARFMLDNLISNSRAALNFHQNLLITAMQVVRQSHGAGANLQTAFATVAASGLTAAEQFPMTNYLRTVGVSTAHGVDQRAAIAPGGAAQLPGAGLATDLGFELDPSSRPAPAPAPAPAGPAGPAPVAPAPVRIPWDGADGAAGSAPARATMKRQLFAAYDAYLKFFHAQTLAAAALPRVAFTAPAAAPGAAGPPATGVVDIANQARDVLEARYATWMDAAATSPTQISARSPLRASGPGQSIFDPFSEADRSTLTATPDLAPGVAWWIFENDRPGAAGAPGSRRFATDVLAAHHYSTQDPGAEQFRWDVANAYAAASTLRPNNKRRLIDYRITQWSESGSSGFSLLSSFSPAGGRNRAELVQRWEIFKDATHESLHLREHPGFAAAAQGRGTMKEGFVEMFTVSTLNTDVLPRVRAGGAEPMRRTVEGTLSPAAPDAAIVTDNVTPAQYAEHRANAERIRDGGTPAGGTAHAGIGEAGVRAAFFQGHVEYLGIDPHGAQLTTLAAAGALVQTRIPGGIAGLDDLASRSGVPRATIVADNFGITDALPATAVLIGCSEHWVVGGESRANIAAQHGVSEADLVRANPDIPTDLARNDWPVLPAGQKILIPRH